MVEPTRFSRRTLGALSVGAIAVHGLRSHNTSAQEATPAASPSAAFPRTIEHVLGETVISAAPQRVVSVSDFNDLDYVVTLGVEPVLYGFTNAWDSGTMPWQGFTESIPSYDASVEFDLEQITAAKPDLIVGMQSVADIYDTLSKIAPTIAIGWDTSWADGLRMVGSALGQDQVAEQKIGEIDALLANARAELEPIAGTKTRVGFQYGDVFYIWGTEAAGSQTLAQLGLDLIGGEDPFLTATSLEQVNQLADAEILLSIDSDPPSIAVQEASPLFQTLPAVQNGGYGVLSVIESRAIGDGVSPLSLEWVLPQLIEFLTALANGEGKKLE